MLKTKNADFILFLTFSIATKNLVKIKDGHVRFYFKIG